MLLSTLVHEMGHGVAAILVGGEFHSFKMWANGSGVASTSGSGQYFGRAFVAAAGLVGPAIVASIFFAFMGSVKKSQVMLATFAIILALSIVLVVRNVFGIAFVFIVCAICFYFSLAKGKDYAQVVLAFFATQLSLSVFSRSDYLFTATALTSAGEMPSDVQQISNALFLPYWFWGALCGQLIASFQSSTKSLLSLYLSARRE